MAHITYWKQPLARGASNNAVLALRATDPTMRAVDIAKRVGISRERVRQILKRSGLQTSIVREPPPVPLCPVCCEPNLTGNRYCSAECHDEAITGRLFCTQCGVVFRRRKYDIRVRAKNIGGYYKTSNVFCSKRCQGNYSGKHYGFVVHQQRRKFPMPSEILAMREAGKSPREIAAVIGSTMHYIYETTWQARKNKGDYILDATTAFQLPPVVWVVSVVLSATLAASSE